MKEGQHLLIDAYDCSAEKLNKRKIIRNFLKELVTKIDMQMLSMPKVYKAINGQPDGLTGFVVISTSHISIHTFVDTRHLWVDILSCKDFNSNDVIKFIKREFDCKINSSVIYRKIYKV